LPNRRIAPRRLFAKAGGKPIDDDMIFGEYAGLIIAELPSDTLGISVIAAWPGVVACAGRSKRWKAVSSP
jgi:uncharacterized protein with GYD domain